MFSQMLQYVLVQKKETKVKIRQNSLVLVASVVLSICVFFFYGYQCKNNLKYFACAFVLLRRTKEGKWPVLFFFGKEIV